MRGADDRAVDRAHAADHHHQQDVQHDREAQRGVRSGIAQPQRIQDAGAGGDQGGDAVGVGQVEHGAEAERLGAETVLPDRLQHAAERRVHHAQQRQDHRRGADEDDIIGEHAAVELEAERGLEINTVPGRSSSGSWKLRPSSPPVSQTVARPAPGRRRPPPA